MLSVNEDRRKLEAGSATFRFFFFFLTRKFNQGSRSEFNAAVPPIRRRRAGSLTLLPTLEFWGLDVCLQYRLYTRSVSKQEMFASRHSYIYIFIELVWLLDEGNGINLGWVVL